MRRILQEISKRTLLLNEFDVTEEQKQTNWLGSKPASDDEIEKAKTLLQTELPEDYIEFLKITNGFPQCTSTSVTFLPVSEIDYLINVDEDLVEIWNKDQELKEIGEALSASLLIGGKNEEQCFLLIPPNDRNKKWRYWKFASWIPGEHEFKNLKDYFQSELTFLKEETKGLKKPKPKLVVDYSLRDYVFNLEWENVYKTTLQFLQENRTFRYFGGQVDLLRLLLLSASKIGWFAKLGKDLLEFKASNLENEWLGALIVRFAEAASNKRSHILDFQMDKFVHQSDTVTCEQIEEQTKTYRPDLLKPKNVHDKVDYQLYFFFEYGNAEAFLSLYEAHSDLHFFNSHIKAAIIYATLGRFSNAQEATERYFQTAFDYRPLEPFLDNVLINIMTEDFSKKMLLQFKQNTSQKEL